MIISIFQTDWGWIGVAANRRGVRALVLPKPTRGAVESELRSLIKENSSVLRQAQHERLLRDAPHSEPVTLSLSKGSSNGTMDSAARHLYSARLAILHYLQGRVRSFRLTLDLEGYPLFRRRVWQILKTIPYGQRRSYGWVARKLGQPRSARAVGQACGANPFPLVIPCHRVVAGNGSLGGFSGGLTLKKRLLKLEGLALRSS